MSQADLAAQASLVAGASNYGHAQQVNDHLAETALMHRSGLAGGDRYSRLEFLDGLDSSLRHTHSTTLAAHNQAFSAIGIPNTAANPPDWLLDTVTPGTTRTMDRIAAQARLDITDAEYQRRARMIIAQESDIINGKAVGSANYLAGEKAKAAGVFEGYRKVASSDACGWCQTVAAGRLYKTTTLPRHEHDRCGSVLVTTGDGWNPQAESDVVHNDWPDRIKDRSTPYDGIADPQPYEYGTPSKPVTHVGDKIPNTHGATQAAQPEIPKHPAIDLDAGGPTPGKWGVEQTRIGTGALGGTPTEVLDAQYAGFRERIAQQMDGLRYRLGRYNAGDQWQELRSKYQRALDRYVSPAYENMNSAARGAGDIVDENLMQLDEHELFMNYGAEGGGGRDFIELVDDAGNAVQNWIHDLEELIDTEGTVTNTIHVTRKDGLPAAFTGYEQELVGRVMTDPAFMSTSAARYATAEGRQVMYAIKVNPGTTKGIWIGNTPQGSPSFGLSFENEYLLQRNTNLFVERVVTNANGNTIVYAQTVSDEWMRANGMQGLNLDAWNYMDPDIDLTDITRRVPGGKP